MTKANIAASVLESWNDSELAQEYIYKEVIGDVRLLIINNDAKVIFDTAEKNSNVGKLANDTLILNALSGSNASDSVEQDGMLYTVAAVPVIKGGETVGAVYLKASAENITQYHNSLKTNIMILFFIVIIVSGLICWAVSHLFTVPINNFTSKIKQMHENDERHTVDISGSNEINVLVSEFNQMVENLDSIDKKRHEFVSNASHELKTPLSSIKLICDSILQNPEVDKTTVLDFLQDMNDEVDRLTRITNKLLALTKSDVSEDAAFEFATLNIKTLSENVVKALRPLAMQKSIYIEEDYKENVFIRADADKIWEAIYNILDNSIKYTSEGGKVIITLSRDEENAYISIKDNGIGMAQDEINKVFDRFYRVDKARARETGGTGLGLSIALNSVQLHGGYINVESKEGEGSTFTIVLPIENEL